MSRALFGEYAAGYAPYIEAISKARTALSGGSELGAIEKSVAAAEEIQKGRISRAQSRGATVYAWMDQNTLNQTLEASELSERHERDLDRIIKQQSHRMALSREEREVNDREVKARASAMITDIAGANLNRMSSFLTNVSQNLGAGKMTYEEAALVITNEFSQIEAALQSAAGINPELASPYRSLFTELRTLGTKIADPKTRNEATEAEFKAIINKAKLVGITTDPKMKAVVVANELLGGQAITALNASAPIADFISRMSNADAQPGEYVPQVVGNPTAEKDVLNFLGRSLQKVNEGGFKDNGKATQELTSSINQVLKQTGDALKVGGLDASKMTDIAKFFASPEYGKFAGSGKLNPEAAQAAKMTFQSLYIPAVQQSITNRLDTAQQNFQGGGGVSAKKIGSLIDVRFSGSGITFDVRQQPAMETYEVGQQTKLVNELNSVKAGINQLVRIGAHMEGHTDYAKYWEENKYLYLPQIYPARAGVIVNGYKSKGGRFDDPKNWEKVE